MQMKREGFWPNVSASDSSSSFPSFAFVHFQSSRDDITKARIEAKKYRRFSGAISWGEMESTQDRDHQWLGRRTSHKNWKNTKKGRFVLRPRLVSRSKRPENGPFLLISTFLKPVTPPQMLIINNLQKLDPSHAPAQSRHKPKVAHDWGLHPNHYRRA
jgi:hypothetical protein